MKTDTECRETRACGRGKKGDESSQWIIVFRVLHNAIRVCRFLRDVSFDVYTRRIYRIIFYAKFVTNFTMLK